MKTAIAMIVKNESRGIQEHLAFHLGVQRFDMALVYDNGSTDDTRAKIAEITRHYPVEVIDWPSADHDRQLKAYEDAAKRLANRVDWMAAIDCDEYIHSTAGRVIGDLLPGAWRAAQVCLNWAIYGSNGHVRAPIGTIIESFTERGRLALPVNRHVKALVRPERVLRCINPHAFLVEGRTVDAEMRDIEWSDTPGIIAGDPPPHEFRVNHYAVRSAEHWQARLARGQASNTETRTEAHRRGLDHNDETDLSAPHFYGQRLHAALAAVTTESIDALPPMARVEGV